jgi:acyl-CoA dehydrogenase
VVFENCRVPRANLLGGEEGNGFRTAMKVLDKGRLHIAALCVGMAERLIRESVQFATTRKQFGKPISEFQLIQAMIADSQADTLAAKALVLETARARDRGERITLEAASAKMFASEMLGRVADRAVQIHGGAGYMAEYAVERFYRDARLFRIFEGTTQIQQLIIARETIKALS